MTKDSEICVTVLKKVEEGLSYEVVGRHTGCAPNTVSNIVKRFRKDGMIEAMGQKGCKHNDRKMAPHVLEALRQIVATKDCMYAREMARDLHTATGKFFTAKDIHKGLKELKMTRKVRTKHNNRADPEKVAEFKQMASQEHFTSFMWSDEAGFTRKEGIRRCLLELTCMRVQGLLLLSHLFAECRSAWWQAINAPCFTVRCQLRDECCTSLTRNGPGPASALCGRLQCLRF